MIINEAMPVASQPPEGFPSTYRHGNGLPDREAQEAKHDRRADEAKFLAGDGEDEVGVLHGQEVKLTLGAVVPALSHQPAVADRDLALVDVVQHRRDGVMHTWIGDLGELFFGTHKAQ